MNRMRMVTLAIVVLGAVAAGTSFAQGPRGGGPAGGRGGPVAGAGLALRGLDLSEAQQEQVRAIRERYQEHAREATRRLAEARGAQRDAIETPPADEGRVIAATQTVAQAEIDVAILQARLNTEIWGVLTPAQQEQVTARRATRDERAGERRGRIEPRRQQRGQPGP